MKLKNTSDSDVMGHYAGNPYHFPAGKTVEVENEAAAVKLAHDLTPRGVVIVVDKKEKTKE